MTISRDCWYCHPRTSFSYVHQEVISANYEGLLCHFIPGGQIRSKRRGFVEIENLYLLPRNLQEEICSMIPVPANMKDRASFLRLQGNDAELLLSNLAMKKLSELGGRFYIIR